MTNLNPRDAIKDVSQKYPYNQRGYYYLSDYSQTIKYLITKWKEIERNRIDNLYFLELKLDDFIKNDLKELNRSLTTNLKTSKQIYYQTEQKLMDIKNQFLIMYDSFYQDKNFA